MGIKRGDYVETGFLQGHYIEDPYTAIGLALKIGLKIVPVDYLGIGVDLHANINAERSVFMPMISLGVGKLKNKAEIDQ